MEPNQENHLQYLKDEFAQMVDKKYRKGQQEHGGDLFDKTPVGLIECAIEEAIDLVVYLVTARDNIITQMEPKGDPNDHK